VYSDGKNKAYSGQGKFVGNFVAFAVFFILFLGAIYALSFWTLENAWIPGIVCLALAGLAFGIPQTILGRSDSLETARAEAAAVVRTK
jgi:hypothetical protein